MFIYLIIGIAGIYIIICLLLFFFQRFLIYFPDNSIILNPTHAGLNFDDVYYKTSDDISINGWLIPADSSEKVVLFCHGNAGNISHRLESIQLFNRLRLNVFIFDYRGFGNSEGRISEEGTYLDAQGAWNFLVHQKGFKPSQIIIFGRSLGSGIASWLASKANPGGVILESSFTSLPDLGSKIYPYFPIRLLARFIYPTERNLEKVECPILFIHSKNDEIIPYALGLENFKSAKEPKEFLEIEGSHNDGFIVSESKYVSGIAQFVDNLCSI
jgi:pimeloyl-ACP methyl ester carboxylesterase